MDQESYAVQIGAIQGIVFADAKKPLTEALVASIFVQDAARMASAWRALPQPEEFCRNILYLETGGRRVLIDSGEGQNDTAQPGRLLALLRGEAIPPESIDTVILTHFHIDHFGGLLDPEGKPNFPNARLVTRRAEYDYWMHSAGFARLTPTRADILRQLFVTYPPEFAEADAEVEAGITLVAAPGHTPGHSAILVESQDARLLHIVDAVHTVLQLRAPECAPRFDVQPQEASVTREALFDRAEREHLLVMAFHLSFPGLGIIGRNEIGERTWTAFRN